MCVSQAQMMSTCDVICDGLAALQGVRPSELHCNAFLCIFLFILFKNTSNAMRFNSDSLSKKHLTDLSVGKHYKYLPREYRLRIFCFGLIYWNNMINVIVRFLPLHNLNKPYHQDDATSLL